MKPEYFIYTRNSESDYKLVYSPSESLCPKETRLFYLKQARGAVNIDTYTLDLEQPKWIFSKKGDSILYGIAVLNSVLSESSNTDYTGTPVRGFFGMVFDANCLEYIPYDIAFFKDMYKRLIVPLWNTTNAEFKKNGVEIGLRLEDYSSITRYDHQIQINEDIERSVILGCHEVKDVLEQVMCITSDVSLITGLSDKSHAFDVEYKYMNSIVEGVNERLEKTYKKEAIQEKVKKEKCSEEDSVQPKKDYRLKLIIAILTLIGLIALIIMISRGTTSTPTGLKDSISGGMMRK